ncbi:MAG: ATP-binding protein [Bacteroidales bacterium]|nr:ATP-binding protein [Bacteroidales bacterium]
MVSVIKLSFHKRLFLQLIAFSWAIVICFIVFQYIREKEYKSEHLSAQLQQYNHHLIYAIEEGFSYEEYISSYKKPFKDLRITLITLSGAVIYDNVISIDSLGNHNNRPEIIEAKKNGSGYHIGRQSTSDGKEYFYSATKGERIIVRTAIPYSNTLQDLLAADWTFILIMIIITLSMSFIAFFTTRKLGKDIEKVNRYEAEQEKNRIKRQLTNNINHELKTPVASIQVCLETLLSGISLSEEKRQELIERCYIHNERLRNLLNDVSLITRIEDGNTLISKEPIVINEIIKEVEEELEIMPENERLILHTDFTQKVAIEGNLSLIGSIFRNLTENAIRYSEGKNIYISLIENDDIKCLIRFEDDGKGVKEEELPHLFERFYRVDKGRSRQMGGTGLGLAIVKHSVQFHGGTIKVSNRPQGGLRFDFSLKK